jgi:preprotein translocase subunit YajC
VAAQEVISMQACLNALFLFFLQAPSGGASYLAWLPLVFIFVIFYFLLILPQQRKQKQWKAMLGNLKTGDNVTTTGGIRGVIVALRDEDIHLRVPPDNIRIAVARSAIAGISMPEEAKKS